MLPMCCPGTISGEHRNHNLLISLTYFAISGANLAEGLVKDITQAVVKNAGTTADQVTVSLVETPRTSKAKGGVLFSEMASR